MTISLQTTMVLSKFLSLSLSNVASICRQTFNSTQLWEKSKGNIFRYINVAAKRKKFPKLVFLVKPRFKVSLCRVSFIYLFSFSSLVFFLFYLTNIHGAWYFEKEKKNKLFHHIPHTVPMVIKWWRHSNIWKSTVGAIYWTIILIIPSYSCSLFFHWFMLSFVGVLFLKFCFLFFYIYININKWKSNSNDITCELNTTTRRWRITFLLLPSSFFVV